MTRAQYSNVPNQHSIPTYDMVRAENEKLAEEHHRELHLKQLKESVSPRYRNKTFDDFKVEFKNQDVVKKIALRFVGTFRDRLNDASCLLFTGRPGTGKTLLARIIEQELALQNYLVHYEPNLRFLRRLHEKNFDSDALLQAALSYFKRVQFLIIDEATEGFSGKLGQLSDWEKQMLFTVIDLRYNEKMSTLIISNRDHEEIVDRIGERTVDRLIENGLSLKFTWKSYRIKE